MGGESLVDLVPAHRGTRVAAPVGLRVVPQEDRGGVLQEDSPSGPAGLGAGTEEVAVVDAAERYPKSTVEVDGVPMAYVEAGEGRPVVLLHGNPTSS